LASENYNIVKKLKFKTSRNATSCFELAIIQPCGKKPEEAEVGKATSDLKG
jgi:hypothetical protein